MSTELLIAKDKWFQDMELLSMMFGNRMIVRASGQAVTYDVLKIAEQVRQKGRPLMPHEMESCIVK